MFILSILCFLQSCFPVKTLFLGKPDKKDLKRFDYAIIEKGNDCFQFYACDSLAKPLIKISDWTKDIPFFVSLDSVVRTHSTRSMLVIQNDTIKYDYYREDLDENDLHASYSIAKSFTSTLIGIAIDEGYILNEQEPVIKYITELADVPNAEKLSIEHLLNHTSGIQYNFTIDATLYYGHDLLKSLNKIKFETKPSTEQHYLNINVQLLGLILKRAVGKAPSKYLEENIWKPIGMCSNGIWSLDKKNQLEKSFCCLGVTALDYAKFGRLYLNKGIWDGEQIFSHKWYDRSIRRDTLNGSSFNYNYCWHIGLKEYDDFMANGLYKQHIYVNPKKNLIIVLLNDKEKALKAERVNWWFIFRQIADQL